MGFLQDQNPVVAPAPTGGRGLALTLDGKIPPQLLPSVPRVVTGMVGASATIIAGTGWTPTGGGGTYGVTFDTAFDTTPVVLASGTTGPNPFVAITAATASGFGAEVIESTTGSLQAQDWNFVAFETL